MEKLQVKGIDPRAYSPHPLPAVHPLPHISRKALKRVRNRLDPPTVCGCCASNQVELIHNEHIYGRGFGRWPYAYWCRACLAYVGLHADTDLPLGTLADVRTREARTKAKELFFDFARKRFQMDLNLSYEWLSGALGIPKEVTHFGMFNEEQAVRVTSIIEKALKA